MASLMGGLKMVAVLVAAMMLGNWFLAEVRRARLEGKPWYQPYLSLPGGAVLLALVIPILIWWLRRQ